jgi:hypothetical protein
MNNQSTIKSSDVLLRVHARYGTTLERIGKALALPDEYRLDVYALHGNDRDDYGVEISGPENFTVNVMRTPVPGNLDVLCGTLESLLDAADAATGDSERRIREATPWHSRYEGIERPRLVLDHTPGWMLEDCSMGSYESVHKLFHSEYAPLSLQFDVFENDGYPISISMGGEVDWNIEGAGELLAIADRADELHRWLNDCATVTAWCHEHDTIAEDAR